MPAIQSSPANALWSDIQAQAANLRHVIDHLYGPEFDHVQAAARALRNDRPIFFIGIGSAAYLSMPAESYLAQAGRAAGTVYASEAVYGRLASLRDANVVINSRSGETVEVRKLSQALQEAAIPFIAITNEPESTLARRATHCIWTDSRKDDLVSINIVTSMMAASVALAAEVTGQTASLRSSMDRLPAAMAETVAGASRHAEQLANFFTGVRPIYTLYRGASKGAAYCARLVLEEVGRQPAIPLEAGEFRQGPIEVLDERFGALVFDAPGEAGELNRALAADLAGNGGRVLLVTSRTDAPSHDRLWPFPIPAVPEALSPVLEVVPAQVLAYQLAERQGYVPGTVRYLSKVITTERGIPSQALTSS